MTDYSFGDVVLVGFPHTDYATVSKRPALVIYDGKDQDIFRNVLFLTGLLSLVFLLDKPR